MILNLVLVMVTCGASEVKLGRKNNVMLSNCYALLNPSLHLIVRPLRSCDPIQGNSGRPTRTPRCCNPMRSCGCCKNRRTTTWQQGNLCLQVTRFDNKLSGSCTPPVFEPQKLCWKSDTLWWDNCTQNVNNLLLYWGFVVFCLLYYGVCKERFFFYRNDGFLSEILPCRFHH